MESCSCDDGKSRTNYASCKEFWFLCVSFLVFVSDICQTAPVRTFPRLKRHMPLSDASVVGNRRPLPGCGMNIYAEWITATPCEGDTSTREEPFRGVASANTHCVFYAHVVTLAIWGSAHFFRKSGDASDKGVCTSSLPATTVEIVNVFCKNTLQLYLTQRFSSFSARWPPIKSI